MNLYQIRDWDRTYENNRTRELKQLAWVPIPNKQDGDGYTAIMSLENGPAIFGAWIACVQIASRCDPRGTLVRDGGKPHDSHSLARMSRMPAGLIEEMLSALSGEDINWLTITIYTNPASSCDATALSCDLVAPRARARPEQKEQKERIEGNGKDTGAVAPKARFEKPTIEALKLQCAKIGLPESEAPHFMNYYESNGWKVGRNPMRSWAAALSNWKLNYESRSNGNGSQHKGNPPQRVDRSIGTANEGTADLYRGLGKVAQVPNPQRPAA